jgi:teichuronic acid biosynthesis glycosyltransferase TuaG
MISIITAAYNCESYITQTICSVQAQTYENWEMIIVDDLSSDKSIAIIQKHSQEDPRIKLIIPTQKLYAAGARNLATQHAQGDYVAFLDADDFWEPEKLELQRQFMCQNDYAFSITSYKKVNSHGQKGSRIFAARPRIDHQMMLYTNPIGCLTVMYSIKKLGKLYFNPHFLYQEDYILWLDTLKDKCDYAYGLDIPLAYYRVHPSAKSSNKLKIARYTWNVVYKDHFKWNIFKRLYYFTFYVFNGLIKYLR